MGEEKLDVEKFARDLAENLCIRNIRVTSIILFGSYARGEATEDSDLDLIVVSPDFGEKADYSKLYRSLPVHMIDVDALPRTPADLAAVEPDSFLAYALEEGKVVYEDAALAKAWAN